MAAIAHKRDLARREVVEMRKAFLSNRVFAALVAAVLTVGLVPVAPAFAGEGAGDASSRAYGGFSDVYPNDWFAESGDLDYAVSHGLLSGYPDGTFGPYDTLTRGQVVTVLWRMAGSPSADAGRFYDVDYGRYYGTAVSWARLTGVVSGYGDTNTFGPEDPVTREQLCVMLANYAGRLCYETTASNCFALDRIAGSDGVSSWARTQMGWAVDEGIISGELVDGIAYVSPQGTALRCAFAKMVSVLHRDSLDGVGCTAQNGGIWHYDGGYATIDLPIDWKSVVDPMPMGNTSGVFHIDFYPIGATNLYPMLLRIDGQRGSGAYEEVTPLTNQAAAVAWDAIRAGKDTGFSRSMIDRMMAVTTGGKMTADDVAMFSSLQEAQDVARAFGNQVRFRAYVR